MSETPPDELRHTYTCEECGGTFESERSQQEAQDEAERLWGVKNAASDPSMAEVCHDCFEAIMREVEP